jgi:6-phosphogluconolactonase
MSSIHIYSNPQDLATKTAETIAAFATRIIRDRGSCALALSGGSTPKLTYERLRTVSPDLDWSRMVLFWSDERCVPPDHPESNFRMANEALISHVPIPSTNIHRMNCSPSPQAGAELYENLLRARFATQGEPAIDLVLLGLGGDGHTASLFPGTQALAEPSRWVVANRVDKLDAWRMTLTYPGLFASGQILFLVQGSEKSQVVHAVLESHDPGLPASRVELKARDTLWYLDKEAAMTLENSGSS